MGLTGAPLSTELHRPSLTRDADGGNYGIYAETFTEVCEPYLNGLDPALHPFAMIVARPFGYIMPADVAAPASRRRSP